MAGIPVHTSSPINANAPTKASAITPSTAAARYVPDPATPTATYSPPEAQSAQPGAPAVPQPTNAAAVTANSAPKPTPTQPLPVSSEPPAPQPGAVPVPGNVSVLRQESSPISPHTTASQPISSFPPAPLPAHQTTGFISTPTRAIPPASVTSTYPGPQDLSHPPGYIQNSRSSFEDRPYLAAEPNDSSSPFTMSGNRRPANGAGRGILNGEMYNPDNGGTQEDKGVWDSAMDWAKMAGKKLSQAEEEVWKRVNGKK